MSEWSKRAEESHEPEDLQGSGINSKSNEVAPASSAGVLPVLQNWQVLDEQDVAELERDGTPIEGRATTVATDELRSALDPASTDTQNDQLAQRSLHTSAASDTESTPQATIPDQLDPTIVVSLSDRHVQVMPGEEVQFTLTILNNGDDRAAYHVVLEGWIREEWLTRSVAQVELNPGERRTVTLTVAPPRHSQVTAGDRSIVFVVRNSENRAHVTRLGAQLTILPYSGLHLGQMQPANASLTWWQKETAVTVPVTNRGNFPVTVRLVGRQVQPFCTYAITFAETAREQERATVAPGETVNATIRLRATRHPFFALHKPTSSLQLTATSIEQADLPYQPWRRTLSLPVTAVPCIGPWQLTSIIGLFAVGLMAMGMVGLVGLLLLSLSLRSPEVAAVAPAPAVVAPQPVIVAYIQAPVPQNSRSSAGAPVNISNGDGVTANPARTPIVVDPNAALLAPQLPQVALPAPADPSAPILLPAQISAPASQSLPENGSAALPIVEIRAPATPAPMTYATMFREIGHRYDLNWRMLAAQAYVESSFDSLALGSQGDLGLMQVHPATWREWAPAVDAADPFDSYSNVLVAATYLDYLRATLSKRGHPEVEWTLVAYNWGIDKVLKHLDSGQGWQELSPNRQAYAIEVLRLAETIPSDG